MSKTQCLNRVIHRISNYQKKNPMTQCWKQIRNVFMSAPHFNFSISLQLYFPQIVCVPSFSFNYWRKSPLPERVGELCQRSSLQSRCALVISFTLGAAARMISHAARHLHSLHSSASTSPHTTQIP